MNTKRIKTQNQDNWFLTVLSVILLFISIGCRNSQSNPYEVEVISLEKEEGFGYVITKNHHIFIYQPFIPAVRGNYPFRYKEDARKVGYFIKQRLERGEDLSVTEKDLLQLNLLSLKGY